MEKKQAFDIVAQACNLAAKEGTIFDLKDSATIFAALGVLGREFQDEAPAPQLVEEQPDKKK